MLKVTELYIDLPIVESTSIDDATFNASSMLLNFSFAKSKFLQQMVSVPC